MIDFINEALGLRIPGPILAMLLGWLVAVGMTQGLKFFIPFAWPHDVRRTAAQLVALLTGFGTVWLLQPAPLPLTAVLAVITGIWAPVSWAMLMAWLKRKHPWIAAVLSQDVRGVLFGTPRGEIDPPAPGDL